VNPWLDAKAYYSQRWGQPVGRVGVDGGFSCPNRGGDRSGPGCAFCAETGNRPPYQAGDDALIEQVRRAKAFLGERYGIQSYSLYFQSYSSTWAPVETLRQIYDQALAQGPFVEMTVGTRPDCLPDAVADLLASFRKPDLDVWVELGLQSSRDETLARIHRGHDVKAFQDAAARLRSRGVPFTAHIMFGLPGEGKQDFLETVRLAIAEGVSGLKFHDLLLVPGTALHRDWQAGLLTPVDPEEYLDAVADALLEVPSQTVVWRVCSDPEDRKKQPGPGLKWSKNRFLNRLREELIKRRSR